MLTHRDKKGGIVSGVVFGVGGLIIGLIVVLVIVSTIGDANLLTDDSTYSTTVTNETATIGSTGVYTLATASLTNFASWNATRVMNGTVGGDMGNVTLKEGTDYVIFSANGSIANRTVWDIGKARVTYAFVRTDTSTKDAVTDFRGNFTSGINNVSSKIPTILLIVAVVFLFGALVLLVRQAGLMGIGGGNSGGSL